MENKQPSLIVNPEDSQKLATLQVSYGWIVDLMTKTEAQTQRSFDKLERRLDMIETNMVRMVDFDSFRVEIDSRLESRSKRQRPSGFGDLESKRDGVVTWAGIKEGAYWIAAVAAAAIILFKLMKLF